MKDKKVLRVSRWTVVSYVVATLLVVYAGTSIVGAVKYLKQYFEAYNTSLMSNLKDAINYILQASVTPLCLAFLVFMTGYLLHAIRGLKPENFIDETSSNWFKIKTFFCNLFNSKKTVKVSKAKASATTGAKSTSSKAASAKTTKTTKAAKPASKAPAKKTTSK